MLSIHRAAAQVLFPKDFMENGFWATQHAMLGLGDIVLPGVMVALLLRYDCAHKRPSTPYFWATYVAYIAGLIFTIVVMCRPTRYSVHFVAPRVSPSEPLVTRCRAALIFCTEREYRTDA